MTGLEALAARCGIEAQFKDARGEIRHTQDATRRAILSAMGLLAADDAAADRLLAEIDRSEWMRPLPPVAVLYPSDGSLVDICLPSGTLAVTWRMALEDGSERRGESAVAQLHLVEQRAFEAQRFERRRLDLGAVLPHGYHELKLDQDSACMTLVVTPGTCWLPPEILEGRRLWGVAAQLYLLRSAGNWGIGDFGDLRTLIDLLKKKGADVLGLNPLHALFADDPEHASPYSPASRLLLNVLNIDVAAIAELADCADAIETINSPSFQSSMQRCRDAPLVEYSAVTRLKMGVLQRIYAHCRANSHSPHWREFIAFRRSQSEAVERAYLFLALRSHFTEQPGGHADWHRWPAEYRNPSDPQVRAFAEQHLDKVAFQAWLQFIADEQLGRAAAAAEPMAIGLYRDLAVGADRCGAETWADSSAVVDSAAVGAPPDIYNPPGQNWGLPPLNPRSLRDQAYRSFIDLIRANMRHAGGLRIDHVMALQQLYWVPQGLQPSEGAYVRYPLRDLVGILALESRRQRCLVVGEDLGTVPEGFRERMAAANVLSYRVLFFERDTDGFLPPDSYPHLALAVAGSHDLPTLRSWWEDADLRLKETLRLFPKSEDARRAWSERGRDRQDLLAALSRAGLPSDPTMTVEVLNQAAHAYLGRSTAALAVAQLDDLTDEATPVNVPTTSQEHPNWRRRLSLSLEELATLPRLERLADIFRKERAHNPRRGESL